MVHPARQRRQRRPRYKRQRLGLRHFLSRGGPVLAGGGGLAGSASACCGAAVRSGAGRLCSPKGVQQAWGAPPLPPSLQAPGTPGPTSQAPANSPRGDDPSAASHRRRSLDEGRWEAMGIFANTRC